MHFDRLFKTLAPVVALAAIGALTACKGGDLRFNGKEGVPLADLDLTGPAPNEVVLLGPDTVLIEPGETLAVRVEGDPAAAGQLRFALGDGTLGILRDRDGAAPSGTATVHVTMPAPGKLVLAGSGRMRAAAVAPQAEVSIAGSGTLETPAIEARRLEVGLAGSGTYIASGTTDDLELSIAGSGSGNLAGLKAARAEINVAGSGDATFASDGAVDARIMGSGTVTVRGSARCTVKSMGSGKLVCERGD